MAAIYMFIVTTAQGGGFRWMASRLLLITSLAVGFPRRLMSSIAIREATPGINSCL